MRTPLLLCGLVGILLLAGCTSSPAAPKTPETPTEPVTNERVWNASWKGSLAFQFTIRPEASTTCASELMYPSSAKPGWTGLILRNPETERFWMVTGSDRHSNQAHAGPFVDSRRITPVAGESTPASLSDEGDVGPEGVTLLLAAHDIPAATDSGPNVRLRVACDAPFELKDLKAGREAVLFDASTTEGGVGLGADTVALGEVGATGQDGVAVELGAPETLTLLVGAYAHGGRAELERPSGREEYLFPPKFEEEPEFHLVRDVAGSYVLRYDEARIFGEFLWGAFIGLHAVESFEQVEALKAGHDHACGVSPLMC